MMKKILSTVIIFLMIIGLLPVYADYVEYTESPAYADVADRINGNESIGAFVDYRALVDRDLKQLLSMNSAERQYLVAQILARAGTIYVGDDVVDFTDSNNTDYLAYALANVAEAKSYLKHYGISSVVDIPLTVNFGGRDEATVKFYKSFLAHAYNSGASDICIRSGGVGVMLDIEELAGALAEQVFSVSLMRRKATNLTEEYASVVKSDSVYQVILYDDNDELNVPLRDSDIVFYSTVDEDRLYCISWEGDATKSRFISTSYEDESLFSPINSRRWFGICNDDMMSVGKFSDVATNHWAYDYINYLSANGIVTGSDGKFSPDADVTREEFVKMLVDALGLIKSDADCNFGDVAPGEWYYKYVSSAFEQGIINGTTESLFGIGECVSRQDIAVMTTRALDYKQIPLDPVLSHYGYFFDSDSISDYAQDAVMTMYISGFVSGDEDYRFNPHAPATRAEVAKIIYMLVDYIERI